MDEVGQRLTAMHSIYLTIFRSELPEEFFEVEMGGNVRICFFPSSVLIELLSSLNEENTDVNVVETVSLPAETK